MHEAQVLDELDKAIEREGLHGALRCLNRRAPHRYTGIYRYEGAVMRNIALFDKFSPELESGGDVTLGDAYCSLVREAGELMFTDARNDPRLYKPGSQVISYCGVLLRDEQGAPFGTLCHFDVQRCEAAIHDIALLRAAAPRMFRAVRSSGLHPP